MHRQLACQDVPEHDYTSLPRSYIKSSSVTQAFLSAPTTEPILSCVYRRSHTLSSLLTPTPRPHPSPPRPVTGTNAGYSSSILATAVLWRTSWQRVTFRLINLGFAAVFLSSAILQYNDNDGIAWAALYFVGKIVDTSRPRRQGTSTSTNSINSDRSFVEKSVATMGTLTLFAGWSLIHLLFAAFARLVFCRFHLDSSVGRSHIVYTI